MGLTAAEHIRRARRYESTAAMITVRHLEHVQDPEPFWTLAEVHRARALKLHEARA